MGISCTRDKICDKCHSLYQSSLGVDDHIMGESFCPKCYAEISEGLDKYDELETKHAEQCRGANCPLCGSEKYSDRKQQIIVTLPLPDRKLSPNSPPASRGGRMAKSVIAKSYRKLSELRVIEQLHKVKRTPWRLAVCIPIFYHKDKRRRDSDNFSAMLKSAYDGLTDAGLIVDDDSKHLKREECRFLIDKANPRVELVVFEVEEIAK